MIRVLTSGISTTIQDLGRFGYRKYGVPVSGAMDLISAADANKILANNENEAVLEMLIKGPILLLEKDCWICLTGADISRELDGVKIDMYQPVFIKAGQELRLGNITEGRYAYLAVKGGFQSEMVMGSRSLCKGITQFHRITKGMLLCHDSVMLDTQTVEQKTKLLVFANFIFSVQKGPDFDLLTTTMQETLLSVSFTINPNSNRMGIRLESNAELSAPEIITSPVQPGTVQLTPSGELIVLGRDAGVTGGYARVLSLDIEEFCKLVQMDTMKNQNVVGFRLAADT